MKKKDVVPAANKDEIVVYQPEGAEFHIAVRVENETVWLTQAQMAELFHATKQNISHHVAKIFKEGELDPRVVVKEYLTTTSHGAISGKTQVHAVKNYNLDVIISVGYRIKSIQGTRFRQWALKIDRPNRKFHDRYMFLDYGLPSEKLFHCGASSKDGGNKITTIMQIECPEVYHALMDLLTATGS